MVCFFCGGGQPFNQEHVLPEWVAQLLKLRRVEISRREHGGAQRSYQKVGSFGLTVRVCERCNNGWMSDLESLVMPFLTPMIVGARRLRLSEEEQIVLAGWLWKLAITFERTQPARYFNVAERRAMTRMDDPPAEDVRIWIGACRRDEIAAVRGGPAEFSSPQGHRMDGTLMTLHIRYFAAQVLATRRLPRVRGVPRAQQDFSAATAQIWPPSIGNVSWPPPIVLDDKSFQNFHFRWNTPIAERLR